MMSCAEGGDQKKNIVVRIWMNQARVQPKSDTQNTPNLHEVNKGQSLSSSKTVPCIS